MFYSIHFSSTETSYETCSPSGFRISLLPSHPSLGDSATSLLIIYIHFSPTEASYEAGCPSGLRISIYKYMLLSSLLQKRRMKLVVLLDFVSVFFLLTLLLVTAQLAFGSQIQDVYTLNFSHPTFLKYTLQLFPVLTLSANFPTIAITLRENLTILFLDNHRSKNVGGGNKNVGGSSDSGDEFTGGNSDSGVKFTGGSSDSVSAGVLCSGGRRSGVWVFRRILIPLLTLLPPLVVSFFTFNVEMLVSVTGKVLKHILIRKSIRSSKNLRIHPKFRFGGILGNLVFRSGQKIVLRSYIMK